MVRLLWKFNFRNDLATYTLPGKKQLPEEDVYNFSEESGG